MWIIPSYFYTSYFTASCNNKILLKFNYKQNKRNYNDSYLFFKVIFLNLLIYYLIYIYLINNVIYMDNTEYLTLYNNIYIKIKLKV